MAKNGLKKVGFVGWRGMVGRVLLARMEEEKDFALIEPHFFSTSAPGSKGPVVKNNQTNLKDAFSLAELKEMEMIVATQGGDYTKKIFSALRSSGWDGYWIDAASTLRLHEDACIVLDPINRKVIDEALKNGCRNFIGGNCTVSVMLMGIGGLMNEGLVEWVSFMSYQAASGAGAKAMEELIQQMNYLANHFQGVDFDSLNADQEMEELFGRNDFPQKTIGQPLVNSLLPWIDTEVQKGQSREESKSFSEANKILNLASPVPIDGTCVRVPTLRCHSKGLTIKLKEKLSLEEIESLLLSSHPWLKIIPNNRKATLENLTPSAVSRTLNIHLGRLRKTNLGEEYLNAFVVGDQLLWGAAEPLRRALLILLGENDRLIHERKE